MEQYQIEAPVTAFRAKPSLSIVIPCFNEAGNIPLLFEEIERHCADIPDREIIFINDGSTDSTERIIGDFCNRYPHVHLLSFIRNFGHQAALRAGIRMAHGRCVLTMDGDMQHPPRLIPLMYRMIQEGYEVVTMVKKGGNQGSMKKLCAQLFYRLFNRFSETKIVVNASDFRIMRESVCAVINRLPERNLILRAIIPTFGFNALNLDYEPDSRFSGKAAYSFDKSFRLAMNAFVNFSTMPFRIAFNSGMIIASISLFLGIFELSISLFTRHRVPVHSEILYSIFFITGIFFMYLGMIGKYLMIILDHLKQRPEYIVKPNARTAVGQNVEPHPVPMESDSWFPRS